MLDLERRSIDRGEVAIRRMMGGLVVVVNGECG